MTGGSVAHQMIVFNLCVLLARLLTGTSLRALHEMRLRAGQRIRYPDVAVIADTIPQTQKTLTDATIVFEVLSDDTAPTDRVEKLIDYAEIPSLRYYIMLEQASRAAIVAKRATAGEWTTRAEIGADIVLPDLNLTLPLDDIYHGLFFPSTATDRSSN
jgi:Uma2 family endonuclease